MTKPEKKEYDKVYYFKNKPKILDRKKQERLIEPDKVSRWRRRTKRSLIDEHGGKCVDCGYIGPSYQFDFDHRDPEKKDFALSRYNYGITKLREEAKKCDLVCVRCHRHRTHRQRCSGCEWCINKPS